MFKTLALSIIAGLVFAANTVRAETLPMATVQYCETEPGKMFEGIQDKYGEIPFIEGRATVQSLQGKYLEANMYMLMNPETRTFTIILVDPTSGLECLWLAGGDIEPSVGGDPI